MNANSDKWWIGILAIVVAVIGGLSLYFMSGSGGAPTTAKETAPASTTETQAQATPAKPAAENTSSADTPAPQQQSAAQSQPPKEAAATTTPAVAVTSDYERARWDPIHFKPAIDKATDADCLKCHQEITEHKVREASPAGVKAADSLAWYQTLDTYEGEQMTFHQRHLSGPLIKKVANMSCITCHQGNNPRDETSNTAADSPTGLTMRKMVDPNICLMCHGQFPYKNMGLPGPWHESGAAFQNNCLLCHAAIRTNRHKVNFLKADAIEKEGAADSDTCYGCHGGRAWYRTSFPYPRHPWPGSGDTVPDWAKGRPTESDLRFLIQGDAAVTPAQNAEQGSKP